MSNVHSTDDYVILSVYITPDYDPDDPLHEVIPTNQYVVELQRLPEDTYPLTFNAFFSYDTIPNGLTENEWINLALPHINSYFVKIDAEFNNSDPETPLEANKTKIFPV